MGTLCGVLWLASCFVDPCELRGQTETSCTPWHSIREWIGIVASCKAAIWRQTYFRQNPHGSNAIGQLCAWSWIRIQDKPTTWHSIKRRLEANNSSCQVGLGRLVNTGQRRACSLLRCQWSLPLRCQSRLVQVYLRARLHHRILLFLEVSLLCIQIGPRSSHSLPLIVNVLNFRIHFWILQRPVILVAPKKPSTITLPTFIPHSAIPVYKSVHPSDAPLPAFFRPSNLSLSTHSTRATSAK